MLRLRLPTPQEALLKPIDTLPSNEGVLLWTLEEIGRRLSVTRERVRQIESRALQKLRATKQRETAALLTRRPA